MAEYVCKVGDPSGRILQHVETAQSEGEAPPEAGGTRLLRFRRPSQLRHLGAAHQAPRRPRHPRQRFPDFQSAVQHPGQSRSAHSEGARSAHRTRRHAQFCARSSPTSASAFVRARCCRKLFRPKVRSRPYTSPSIAAGERSGNLTGVLDQYISYLRSQHRFSQPLDHHR